MTGERKCSVKFIGGTPFHYDDALLIVTLKYPLFHSQIPYGPFFSNPYVSSSLTHVDNVPERRPMSQSVEIGIEEWE